MGAGRRGEIGIVLAAAGVVVAALEWTGGVGERVSGPDLHALILPAYQASVHALFAERRLPLWNPYVFCGMPLLGATQGASLYPPVWLAFGLLPARPALQALYALHLVILAIGSVVYLRRHDVPAWAAAIVPAATMAGLARGITGSGYDHPGFLGAMAWVPWALLAAETRAAGALAFAVAAQWLAGAPGFAVDTAIVLGVVTAVGAGRTRPQAFAIVAAGVALGAVIAAVEILPLADALAEGAVEAGATTGLDVVSPGSLADVVRGLVERDGFALLGLSLACFARPRRVVGAWTAALVCALFAVTPSLAWLYASPPFAAAQVPFGWTGLTPFLLGCLGAYGAAVLARHARWLGTGFALVAIAEAMRLLMGVPETLPERARDPALLARRARVLAEGRHSFERILSPWDMLGGTPLRFALPSPGGWDPALAPRRVLRLLRAAGVTERGPETALEWRRVLPHADVLAILGVGTLVVPPEVGTAFWRSGLHAAGGVPPDDLLVQVVPLPRARLVHRVVAVADEDASLARVLAHPKDATHTVVLETAQPPAADEPPADAEERIAVAIDEPERIVLDVSAAAAGVVVVGDSFYRGWMATIDERPVPILAADHAFRAVAVSPGRHRVEMRYEPRGLRIAVLGSALALFAALASVVMRVDRIGARA